MPFERYIIAVIFLNTGKCGCKELLVRSILPDAVSSDESFNGPIVYADS